MPSAWKEAALRLEYQLGEMPVLRLGLRGLTLTGGAPIGDEPGPPPAPPPELRAGSSEVALAASLPVSEPLPRLSLHEGHLRYVPAQYRRHYVDLRSGTFQEYLAGFSARTRSALRRKIRKCSESGELECREYRTPGQIADFLALARPLSERTYQQRLLGRGLPEGPDFESELEGLAAADQVRAYLLTVAGRPAAFILCPIEEGVVQYEWVGYEPDLAALSPGTVLQYLVLERLFSEGRHRAFDFTEGDGTHKEFWSRSHARCANVYYFPPTIRSALLVTSHAALQTTSRAATALLDRLGLKQRLKAALRTLI